MQQNQTTSDKRLTLLLCGHSGKHGLVTVTVTKTWQQNVAPITIFGFICIKCCSGSSRGSRGNSSTIDTKMSGAKWARGVYAMRSHTKLQQEQQQQQQQRQQQQKEQQLAGKQGCKVPHTVGCNGDTINWTTDWTANMSPVASCLLPQLASTCHSLHQQSALDNRQSGNRHRHAHVKHMLPLISFGTHTPPFLVHTSTSNLLIFSHVASISRAFPNSSKYYCLHLCLCLISHSR